MEYLIRLIRVILEAVECAGCGLLLVITGCKMGGEFFDYLRYYVLDFGGKFYDARSCLLCEQTDRHGIPITVINMSL
jgi:hypothetical protein